MEKGRAGEQGSKRIKEKDTTLRCLNCFKSIKIQSGTERTACLNCGEEYIIGWRGKGKRQAKILGVPIPGRHN